MQVTFSRHFKDGMFDSWEPSFVFGEAGISACNRYFQHRGETLPDEVVPFSEHVDPNHMLEAAPEGSYCHTINNHVVYGWVGRFTKVCRPSLVSCCMCG